MKIVKATQQTVPLWQHHAPGCKGSFRRLYHRKVERERERPKWTAVGYLCDECLAVVLD